LICGIVCGKKEKAYDKGQQPRRYVAGLSGLMLAGSLIAFLLPRNPTFVYIIAADQQQDRR
jgi:hypothetical protein